VCESRLSVTPYSTSHHSVVQFNTVACHQNWSAAMITDCSRVLDKQMAPQLVKKFHILCRNRRFITVFTTAASCLYSETDQSSSLPSPPLLFLEDVNLPLCALPQAS